MRNFIIIFLMAFTCSNLLMAQDGLSKKEQRKAAKEESRRLEIEEQEKQINNVTTGVKDSAIVIESYIIKDGFSNTYQVNSSTNFIKIDGDEFIIQTSNPYFIGSNGLGGVTITGDIISYEVDENKKSQTFNIRIEFNSLITGHSVAYLLINPGGISTARINDNHGNRISFQGRANALFNSSVFQGNEAFF